MNIDHVLERIQWYPNVLRSVQDLIWNPESGY